MKTIGTDIRLLEEAAANMLPPHQSILYDGWLLRFSPGKSRNPNSVWPLYDSHKSLESKIEFCEQQYRTRGLKCSFRLSELNDHVAIQDLLTDRGYRALDPNIVMCATDTKTTETDGTNVDLDTWLDTILEIDPDLDATSIEWKRGPLSRISLPSYYTLVYRDGKACAYGRSVQQNHLYQIAELWTTSELRSQGIGTQLISDLIKRGIQTGAKTTFLTVAESNTGARRLYERLGFTDGFRFRYLVSQD